MQKAFVQKVFLPVIPDLIRYPEVLKDTGFRRLLGSDPGFAGMTRFTVVPYHS